MSILMIMSLGGSPEPLKKSIKEHKPGQIVFLASHDSVTLAGEILKGLRLSLAFTNRTSFHKMEGMTWNGMDCDIHRRGHW